ncbi:GNAT family N-acetyltransferase [Alicyclobacillus fastidiosus]|uniref:GNAT family N-acetyltransferase n=1 Tax=Alicyclobacillus fastidiosus TaxID=392011 RepID=A0ABY6ZFG1_9BACL|nr:GNAT family N-acetyltransferase [Alicyclobacillus fastidiosus]WAH40956.1 GNAT family N-acetyltransferase [Alicyclobacillus fastidiosus]GMA62467.1 N-acetyltransferase [Alicyclobacillus fastidiosus]
MKVVFVTTEEELGECLAVRRAVFMEEQGVSEEEEIDDQDVIGVGHHVLVVDGGGRAVATARYKPYDAQTAKIQRVAVLHPYRKYGYGRVVMNAVEQMAARDGFRAAVLDAQCHAEGFYERLGYETISDVPFLDAGILHVRMKKPIKVSSTVE